MGRPTTKSDLISAAGEKYEKLNALITTLTVEELSTPFDFSGDERKKRLIGKGIKISGMS